MSFLDTSEYPTTISMSSARDRRAIRRAAHKQKQEANARNRKRGECFRTALRITTKNLCKGQVRFACHALVQVYREVQELFTLDQSEELLCTPRKDIDDYHKFQNLAVAICEEPWNVDVALGGSGVCYYGNLGERPSEEKQKHILRSNRKYLMTYRA